LSSCNVCTQEVEIAEGEEGMGVVATHTHNSHFMGEGRGGIFFWEKCTIKTIKARFFIDMNFFL
jgi:hypothetical protein